MGGKSEGWGKRMGKRGQNKLLDRGTMGFSTGEVWRVKRVRIGMSG
jgi:hypothetical protein